MINFFFCKIWQNIPEKSRKTVLYVSLAIVSVIVLLWFFQCRSETQLATAIINGYADRQKYELERTERMIDAIERRKESELNAIKGERISDDNVLDTLATLLRGHDGK